MQTQIIDFLTLKGFYVFKFNNGGHKVRGGYIRTKKSSNGIADVIGVSPDGRFVAVECKKPGGVASKEQVAFIDDVKKRGGFALIAYSLGDVIQALEIV